MLGYAVIDCETTGLNIRKNDRIIEIAVVLLDENFRITGMYETILNPERDLGLVSLHGIDGLIASEGSSFVKIMPSLSSLLHDRVIVGQNVQFDTGMFEFEYNKQNIQPDFGLAIDTIQIAKSLNLRVSNYKLETLCNYFNIPLVDSHQAMSDAIATAHLFVTLINQFNPRVRCYAADMRSSQRTNDFSEWKTRSEINGALAQPVHLGDAIGRLHDVTADLPEKSIEVYLKTIHLALLNGRFSARERVLMESLIAKLGLTKRNTIDLNEEYIFMLICKNLAQHNRVWNESHITEHIEIVSAFTGVKDYTVKDMLKQTLEQHHLIEPTVLKLNSYFALNSGDAFSVTGEELDYDREYWARTLTQRGLIYKDSTTKTTKFVIASDPYSLSSKAVTARKYGLPVLTENTLTKHLL